ncbi:MAG: DUF2130 domain-containing protein [Bacteroidetes bacterium]|nr:MAG: DUF2130 domain-containing protein [Bacteroidota bacterium]
MATLITCPHCKNAFGLEEVMTDDLKKELRAEMIAYKNKKDDEVKYLQEQLIKKDQEIVEKIAIAARIKEEELKKQISKENETKLRFLEQRTAQAELKAKELESKELEALRLQNELDALKRDGELEKKKYLLENSNRLIDEALKKERENFELEKREMQIKLEQQRKKVDEMQKKLEVGSQQLAGETQELALEDTLKASFPFDIISEVGKGVRGADCVQTIRNALGQECGKIIYESKRTNAFFMDWIEKLKADMRSQGAHVAVIVTKTMPRDMECFGEKNGVWICTYSEVKALAHVLRDGVIRIFNAAKSQQNKGDKMQLLYDYLTSTEFTEQWKAIREGFLSMKISIQKERDTMEKLWKAREKQLEKVLLNASHIKGSVEGIAGHDSIDMNLLDDGSEELSSISL